MRLVHVSDLHFGRHNEELANNLRDRLAALGPDMIVCTGDLADDPDEGLIRKALEYLKSVQAACASSNPDASPNLMIVPGNHDVRRAGFLDRRRGRGLTVLTETTPDYYLEDDNVWVFGFDSAGGGKLGGSGFISDADIMRFHERYERLQRDHGPKFTKSTVKIVAVHHHPLPVTAGHSWRARWLTMTNAGRLLSAVLFREVDLVLHGHEHVQAQARVWSSLGSGDRGVCIVSLGATLRQLGGNARNWFGVVDASPTEVDVRFYRSIGDAFENEPHRMPFHVRSRSQSAKLAFENQAAARDYSYQALASICVLDKDGDARRTVECEGLIVTRATCERASRHPIRLPHTSGYVSALRATTLSGRQVMLDQSIPREYRGHDFETSLRFDGPLATRETMSYRYEWQAVNSFALNEREFNFMHPRGESAHNVEFSHYVVADPARTLTVIVQFPDGFVARPRLRVTEYEDQKGAAEWARRPDIEQTLAANYALRYFETIRTVALRVPYPQQGLSYGIEWIVPPAPEEAGDDRLSLISDQVRRVLSRGPLGPEAAAALQDLLAGSIQAGRKSIVQTEGGHAWAGPLEASFMVFDGAQHLRCLAAAVDVPGGPRPVPCDLRLKFGDGIAGRAFKANEFRFYDAQRAREDEPDYYTRFDDGPRHDVLVAFPIYPPSPTGDRRAPYGVLSIGSEDPTCPLRFAAADPERRKRVARFHSDLNRLLFDRLKTVFLERPVDSAG
jgi:predicted phosphodiesterase